MRKTIQKAYCDLCGEEIDLDKSGWTSSVDRAYDSFSSDSHSGLFANLQVRYAVSGSPADVCDRCKARILNDMLKQIGGTDEDH